MTAPPRQRAAPVLGPAVGSVGRFRWLHDLVLGVRLAVGGGRTSWARLVLGTIGVGMAATVLLVAASLGHILSDQAARTAARQTDSAAVPGVAPLDYILRWHAVPRHGDRRLVRAGHRPDIARAARYRSRARSERGGVVTRPGRIARLASRRPARGPGSRSG